jgi:hypothetical protein
MESLDVPKYTVLHTCSSVHRMGYRYHLANQIYPERQFQADLSNVILVVALRAR